MRSLMGSFNLSLKNPYMNQKNYHLIDDFPRGVTTRELDKQKVPMSAWANPADILNSQALTWDPSKILLGAVGSTLVGVRDDRHICTIAGSRAGKGVSAIIPNLIHYQGSVLAIDPKGELASITAQRRAEIRRKGRTAKVPGVKTRQRANSRLFAP